MLAGLIVQAEARGTDMATLRALIEEASNLGAERALARLGLSDGDAGKDLGELRQLLQAWRDAKRTARAAVIGWLVRGCLAVLLLVNVAAGNILLRGRMGFLIAALATLTVMFEQFYFATQTGDKD